MALQQSWDIHSKRRQIMLASRGANSTGTKARGEGGGKVSQQGVQVSFSKGWASIQGRHQGSQELENFHFSERGTLCLQAGS